jgi:hypothetical protein
MTLFHLRDATRPSFAPVTDALSLLPCLLRRMGSRRLGDVIATSGVGTTFALTWLLTWHVHGLTSNDSSTNAMMHRDARKRRDVVNLELASRLVDCFLASHPLLPLYVGAVALARREEELLAAWTSSSSTTFGRAFGRTFARTFGLKLSSHRLVARPGGDVGELHAALSRTRLVRDANLRSRRRALCELDGVLRDALETFETHPPRALYEAAGVFPPPGSACEMYEARSISTPRKLFPRREDYSHWSPYDRVLRDVRVDPRGLYVYHPAHLSAQCGRSLAFTPDAPRRLWTPSDAFARRLDRYSLRTGKYLAQRGYVWTRDDVDGCFERDVQAPTPRAVALGPGAVGSSNAFLSSDGETDRDRFPRDRPNTAFDRF